jgi:hypothetical protein
MSLKLKHVQLGMKYLQLLLPVAKSEAGSSSDFFKEVQNIEEKLGILLRQLQVRSKEILTITAFEQLKDHMKNLKTQLELKEGSTDYQLLEGPTKQLLTQVEIIIEKIPY